MYTSIFQKYISWKFSQFKFSNLKTHRRTKIQEISSNRFQYFKYYSFFFFLLLHCIFHYACPFLFFIYTSFVQSFSRAPLKIRAMNKENASIETPFVEKSIKGYWSSENWLIRRTINAPYIGEQGAINRNWTKRGKRERNDFRRFIPGIRVFEESANARGVYVLVCKLRTSRISMTKERKTLYSKANLTGYSSSRRIVTGTCSRGKNIR